jgi:DNA-binding MarR family transcriptional regulator
MLKMLRQLALGAVGVLGSLAKMIGDKRQARMPPDAPKLLGYLATHTSSPIPELSSRLRLPAEATLRLLVDLEQRGWVQLSGEQGNANVRIAAITKAGREQIAQSQRASKGGSSPQEGGSQGA